MFIIIWKGKKKIERDCSVFFQQQYSSPTLICFHLMSFYLLLSTLDLHPFWVASLLKCYLHPCLMYHLGETRHHAQTSLCANSTYLWDENHLACHFILNYCLTIDLLIECLLSNLFSNLFIFLISLLPIIDNTITQQKCKTDLLLQILSSVPTILYVMHQTPHLSLDKCLLFSVTMLITIALKHVCLELTNQTIKKHYKVINHLHP